MKHPEPKKLTYTRQKSEKKRRRKPKLEERLGRSPKIEEKSTEAFEQELESEEHARQKKQLRTERTGRIAGRIFQVVLAGLCVYTVFLIYGLLSTEYVYDADGNVVPKVVTEYEELLDRVSAQTVAIEALTLETKYGQFRSMLLEWVKTDAAVYLQNVSAAILQNDEQKEAEHSPLLVAP